MTPEERLSYEAARRAAADPKLMAAFRKRIGEIRWAKLTERYRK